MAEWIQKLEAEKKKEDDTRQKIKELQAQIERMSKGDNRTTCYATNVNLFANLNLLQGEGVAGVDLAAKAQAAMTAATAEKRHHEVDEGYEGESEFSHSGKKQKFSGLVNRVTHKIKMEVEWAHHWLGKEFEVNPLPFNQIKLGQYMMGEAEILIRCNKPEEIKACLCLM